MAKFPQWKKFLQHTTKECWGSRVVQLPDVLGSNPVIGKNFYSTLIAVNCRKDKTKEKRGPFLQQNCVGKSNLNAKPQVSLAAPNCDHFAWVSLTVLDNFLDAITKLKN